MNKIINLKNYIISDIARFFAIPLFAQPGRGQGQRRQMTEEDQMKKYNQRIEERM